MGNDYGGGGGEGSNDGPADPGGDEDGDEIDIICSDPTSTTTSSSRAPTTTLEQPKPTKSPLEEGRPMDNLRSCYDGGQRATNAQLRNTARSFCRGLGREGDVLRNPLRHIGSNGNLVREVNEELPANGQWPIHVVASLTVKPGCEFPIDYAKCERYLRAPVDSCNCSGENGKQGGTIENRCLKWRIDPQTFG